MVCTVPSWIFGRQSQKNTKAIDQINYQTIVTICIVRIHINCVSWLITCFSETKIRKKYKCTHVSITIKMITLYNICFNTYAYRNRMIQDYLTWTLIAYVAFSLPTLCIRSFPKRFFSVWNSFMEPFSSKPFQRR